LVVSIDRGTIHMTSIMVHVYCFLQESSTSSYLLPVTYYVQKISPVFLRKNESSKVQETKTIKEASLSEEAHCFLPDMLKSQCKLVRGSFCPGHSTIDSADLLVDDTS